MEQQEQNSDTFVVDPNTWAKMTETEQESYLDELLKTKKNFILNGVRYVEDSNQGPVSWTSNVWSGKPKNPSHE